TSVARPLGVGKPPGPSSRNAFVRATSALVTTRVHFPTSPVAPEPADGEATTSATNTPATARTEEERLVGNMLAERDNVSPSRPGQTPSPRSIPEQPDTESALRGHSRTLAEAQVLGSDAAASALVVPMRGVTALALLAIAPAVFSGCGASGSQQWTPQNRLTRQDSINEPSP